MLRTLKRAVQHFKNFWLMAGFDGNGPVFFLKNAVAIPQQLGNLPEDWCGVVAQLVERLVRNEKVRGSIPLGSTSSISAQPAIAK